MVVAVPVLRVRAAAPSFVPLIGVRFTAFFAAAAVLISAALALIRRSCDSSLVTRVTVPAAVPNLRATVFKRVSRALDFFLVAMFSSGAFSVPKKSRQK
jgi:hypothetical protein